MLTKSVATLCPQGELFAAQQKNELALSKTGILTSPASLSAHKPLSRKKLRLPFQPRTLTHRRAITQHRSELHKPTGKTCKRYYNAPHNKRNFATKSERQNHWLYLAADTVAQQKPWSLTPVRFATTSLGKPIDFFLLSKTPCSE